MTPLNQLSDAEILDLTEEQIDKYVELECAEKGVPLPMTQLPEKPEPLIFKPDLKLMEFSAFTVTQELGEQIQALLIQNGMYLRPYGKDYHYRIGHDNYEFQTPRVIHAQSQGASLANEDKNINLNEQWRVYNDAKDEQENRSDQVREIRKEVINYISGERQRIFTQESLVEDWKRYLALAEHNQDIAKNFFVKAYGQDSFEALGVES